MAQKDNPLPLPEDPEKPDMSWLLEGGSKSTLQKLKRFFTKHFRPYLTEESLWWPYKNRVHGAVGEQMHADPISMIDLQSGLHVALGSQSPEERLYEHVTAKITGVEHGNPDSILFEQEIAQHFAETILTSLETRGKKINLKEFEKRGEFLVKALNDPATRAAALREFTRHGKLTPVPRFFWGVERTVDGKGGYNERLGVDLLGIFQDIAKEKEGEKFNALELGPGAGFAKAQIEQALGDHCDVYGLGDRLPYAIDTLLDACIDWDAVNVAVREKCGKDHSGLTQNERKTLCLFLWRIAFLKEFDDKGNEAWYDMNRLDAVTRDPEAIISLLQELVTRLPTVNRIPYKGDGPDAAGRIHVWNWLDKIDSPVFHAACEALGQGVEQFLRVGKGKKDIYEVIPVKPPRIITADFSAIENLQKHSATVIYGVRGPVYIDETTPDEKRGADFLTRPLKENYVRFLENITEVSTEDGLYFAEDIRENYGFGYRLQELAELRRRTIGTGLKIFVVLGPGQPGDDDHRGLVPLMVVLTRSKERLDSVHRHLLPGCDLISIDDLMEEIKQNDAYRAALSAPHPSWKKKESLRESAKVDRTGV